MIEERLRDMRQRRTVPAERFGSDQHQRGDAPGMLGRDHLRDISTKRHANQMRPLEPAGVENGDDIAGQILDRVVGLSRRNGGGSSGIAVIEADHEVAAFGQCGAEFVRPAEHGGRGPHHEQHRRVSGTAEGLDGQTDAVVFDRMHPAPFPGAHATA